MTAHAHERLSAPDREALSAMQARRDWIWISGNHDPALPPDLGGVVANEVAIGPIAFRHEPTGASGEIAGHLHPKARVATRGRSMERRCFASDGERAVMPAFGAYTGGLSIRDPAFAKIFQTPGFMAHVLGDNRAARDCGVAVLLSDSIRRGILSLAPLGWAEVVLRAIRLRPDAPRASTRGESPSPDPLPQERGEGAHHDCSLDYAAFACTASQNSASRSASRSVAGLASGEATSATSVRSIGAKPSFAVSTR